MEGLIEWGYGAIAAVQSVRSPVADLLAGALSFLGREEFYLLLVPLLYWVVDKRLATHFAVLYLLSVYVNSIAKEVAAQPRPSATRVTILDEAEGGGLPSGHAQLAATSWGFLAARRPVRWFRWAMAALAAGIGLSRIYLGAHFPHDVLAGWVLGGAILLAYLALAPRVAPWLAAQPLALQVALGGGSALLLALFYHGGNALAATATLFGLALGVPLERAAVAFHVAATRDRRVFRLAGRVALGLVVALLIWRGLRPLLEPLAAPGDFLRYGLLGCWVSVGAPWVFVKTGLAVRERPAAAPASSIARLEARSMH